MKGGLGMVVHLFLFTITISKRKFSGAEVERAHKAQLNEQILQENKQRCISVKHIL